MAKASLHVEFRGGTNWAVRKHGATRASKVYTSKSKAVKAGRELASKSQMALYIHRSDGIVQEKLSFPEQAPALAQRRK